MVALVPTLIGAGWLISLCPTGEAPRGRLIRGTAALATLAGLLVSLGTASAFMKVDDNVYDQSFHYALTSNLTRITAHPSPASQSGPASVYANDKALGTFIEAAIYSRKSVLLDELAFPGLILARDTTAPFRTRTEDGDRFWDRLLRQPRTHQIEYLVVANPSAPTPGYPRDMVSEHYPSAYAGRLAHSRVIFRNPLAAVVQLLPRKSVTAPILPATRSKLLQLYQTLPALRPTHPAGRHSRRKSRG